MKTGLGLQELAAAELDRQNGAKRDRLAAA